MASRHELRARHTEEKQKQNPQQRLKRNMAVAAAIGVFAKTYYIDNGDITIDGNDITYYDDDKNQQQGKDDNITITQHDNTTATDNTITIKADEDETVEVTIEDINIDTSSKTDEDGNELEEAAISIEGAGDVVLELDGDNVVKSGYHHAGVETTGSGMLTIEDEDHDGSLDAMGGTNGAGIGGGKDGDGNVTINGGTVTAIGNTYGTGIGGGDDGDGKVTINGGIVTVTGGGYGAGIGGGRYGAGEVTISGGKITAKGGWSGAGIGGGFCSDGEVTINDGTITATGGGCGAGIGGGNDGTGKVTINGGTIMSEAIDDAAGIGGGYEGAGNVTINGGTVTATGKRGDGREGAPNVIGAGRYWGDEEKPKSTVAYNGGTIIEQWDENGHTHSFTNAKRDGCKITETCSCGSVKTTFDHVWDNGVVTKQPTTTEEGTRTYTCQDCGATQTERIPKLAETSASVAALTVTTLSGAPQTYEKSVADGRAIFSAPAQDAILTGSLSALAELKAQGATTLVFRTTLCETSVSLDKILSAGSADDMFALMHKGTQAVLTVAGRVIK